MLFAIRPGWIVNDRSGLYWYAGKVEWDEHMEAWDSLTVCELSPCSCIVDPWPGDPYGGPVCILELA